jgi:hypothetical protein
MFMHNKLLDLADQSVDDSRYIPYSQFEQPIILFGSYVKSLYDEHRFTIKSAFKPINLKVSDRCYHGITLQPSSLFKSVCNVLRDFPFDHTDHINIYKQRLQLYNMTCDECFAYLQPGVFPIDISNLKLLTINNRYIQMNHQLLLDDHDGELPWYSQLGQFKLYIML